jgi:hypothetical protein
VHNLRLANWSMGATGPLPMNREVDVDIVHI